MRISLFIFLSLLSASLFAGQAAQREIARGGILDLRETVVDEKSFISLNGEWEFYWKNLHSPSSDPGPGNKEALLVTVPSFWDSYEKDGQKLDSKGYGTYALTILLPEDYQETFCIDIPVFDVAFNFYVNKRLVHSSGTVGTTWEEEKPWYEGSRFCFVPDSDSLRILVQVSNFHHRRGGFWKGIYAGGKEAVLGRVEHNRMYNYSTIGVLFFFTFFFFIFWVASRDDRSMLFFSLTTLGILMRTVNSGLYFSNYFLDAPWAWQVRMEYTGTYLAFLFGAYFLNEVIPRKFMAPVLRIIAVLFALLLLSVFVMPPVYFAFGMLVFQPLIVLLVLTYLVISFTGLLKLQLMDTVFFFSLALFVFALVNDIMLANSVGSTGPNYISQISFQVFILAMAVMVIYQWTRHKKAMYQMEEALRFKNRVLSVIAHDLKNPVASIAQFSDLMVSKPELMGKKHLLLALQESAQAAVGFLDNLLYWGRSQADELSIHPNFVDMEKLVKNVEALFVHMASQKQINLSIQVKEGTQVYADESLVNIILRNLVSNALKFTPSRGEVKIKARMLDTQVEVIVSDTGQGIEPQMVDNFRKNGLMQSSPGTEMEKGTGLGLQLVVNLVKTCGGSLEVRSEIGKGSEFIFTLPTQKNTEK